MVSKIHSTRLLRLAVYKEKENEDSFPPSLCIGECKAANMYKKRQSFINPFAINIYIFCDRFKRIMSF